MSDSQSHRPAVSVKRSPSSRIQKLLERASDLEKQLTNLSKSNDEKAARLRSHLCEILSDILISDPLVGIENDCTGRLWRSCFYAPIGIWRSRISREKRKHGPNLASLEQSFKKFLGEAITLYDYLVLQFQSKLVPSNSQLNSQESTQESLLPEGSLEGVIPGLFRLYIHMGDLHRYAESYNKAEVCYLNACKLAPGMGNPYNQLAVVAQMKDASMSCVALYWYARSLLATHDSFETSNSNLERLFNINRAYLKEHSRDPAPPILSPANKKTPSDLVRAQKAAASKSCLAHFVDFHYELFKNNESDENKESILRNKMTAIIKSFQSLLQASAFGDSLLCKMVVINTFALEMERESKIAVTQRLAKDFLFLLGATLAERLNHVLSKIVEKTGKLPPSIRLLLPFGILCEFIEHLENDKRTEDENTFWQQLVEVANLVLLFSQRLEGSSTPGANPENAPVALKEYQLLKGYRPYSFLNKDYSSPNPFISPLEAVDVLELTLSQSQECNGSADEKKAKVVRFLAFCDRCSDKKNIPITHHSNGYLFSDVERDFDGNTTDHEMTDHYVLNAADEDVPMQSTRTESTRTEADEAGDVVLFKVPKDGGGPALLVPGAMLSSPATAQGPPTQGVKDKVNQELEPYQGTHSARNNTTEDSAGSLSKNTLDAGESSLPPPPGIKPPPGFGIPIAQPIAMHASASHPQGVFGQVMPGNAGRAATHYSALSPQAPGFGYSTPSNLQGPLGPSQRHDFPLDGQSMYWFGGTEALSTANPFAGPQVNFAGSNNPNPIIYQAEASNVDGASLLGSGLLDSLWMNDSTGNKTKNPFVANK